MREYLHLTPRRNVAKIMREGLQPRMGRIWLLERFRLTPVFVDHIAKHHGVDASELTCLYVTVPSTVSLTKCKGKWEGFALAYGRIPPSCIR